MNKNIVWHKERVTRTLREKLNGNRGVCVWLTGLSGSGKSTIANELDFQLNEKGVHTYLLDGDNIRLGLNANLDFSNSGRKENIRRIGEVAKLFVDAGIVVITAFISPFAEDRNNVRKLLSDNDFVEILIQCDLETCELRDPKGLYKKARLGEIKDFTGISSPYEEPKNPELIIDNGKNSDLNFNVEKIIQYLENKTYIDKI
ncbi:MAG: adenylyl-sulfate kinase [Ignavibacteriales bacterium]|nr:adenylyl-sulfate kinase [Ignavibacteriales bacterium]